LKMLLYKIYLRNQESHTSKSKVGTKQSTNSVHKQQQRYCAKNYTALLVFFNYSIPTILVAMYLVY